MSDIAGANAYDVVVIGGGHNGMVAAAYLAKAGMKVLILERRAVLGGAAATEEVFPGYRINTGSNDAGLLLPRIQADLDLSAHGLRFIDSPAAVFNPQENGRDLVLWHDPQKTAEEIAIYSPRDADKLPGYLRLVSRLAAILGEILTLVPPPLPKYTLRELLPWLPVALRAKRLDDADLQELLRILPMPVSDFLDEWFEDTRLKLILGFTGMIGSFQGPRASGTAFQLLYQAIGAGASAVRGCRLVQGGTGALAEALASVARRSGAEIQHSCTVRNVTIENGRAIGVELEDGTRIASRFVLSNADPSQTYFKLVGAYHLPLRFVREVKNIKYRGSTARVNLALNGLPEFNHTREGHAHLTGKILVCQDLEQLERAFDAAKYGGLPKLPVLDLVIPTLSDASLASPANHFLSIDVRYCPYYLKESNWDDQRDSLGDIVIETLSRFAPNVPDLITHRQVITPLDYERDYALTEGSIYHGQMGLDQLLFMRPVAGSQGARSPIQGLYLCGSGAHPGGGVTGAPGYNAARQVLNSLKAAR